jgi:Flp pilus assembly protein TadG
VTLDFCRKPRDPSRQGGQAIVMLALALVLLLGIVGLAVDGGRAYVDRRALQSAADVASDAGMRMLLENYDNQVSSSPGPVPYVHSTIKSHIVDIIGYNAASLTGISSYTVSYVDETGGVFKDLLAGSTSDFAPLCTSPNQTSCTAGVKVIPNYSHSTLVLGAVGETSSSESAVSSSIYRLTAPATGGPAPYVVWKNSCDDGVDVAAPEPSVPDDDTAPDSDPVDAKDQVVYHQTNGYAKHGVPTLCGTGGNCCGNAKFKGFLKPNAVEDPGYQQANCANGSNIGSATLSTLVSGNCYATGQGESGNPTQLLFPKDAQGHQLPVIMPTLCALNDGWAQVCGFSAVLANPDQDTGTVLYTCAAGSTENNCIAPPGEVIVSSGFLQ